MTDFVSILRTLTHSGVEFVVVGGFAAVVHGSSQVTRDVDVCTMVTDETVEKLRRVLAPFVRDIADRTEVELHRFS